MPSMQTPRHAFALAAMMHTAVDDAEGDDGGRDRGKPALYATGGWMYGSCCTGSVERYVEGASEWEPCASLRTPRRLHGAAALGNRLYVFGGSPGNGAVDAKVKVSRRRRTTRKKDRKLDSFPWDAPASLATPCFRATLKEGAWMLVVELIDCRPMLLSATFLMRTAGSRGTFDNLPPPPVSLLR